VTDLAGRLLEVIGSGKMGCADGGFADGSFNHPQGLALRDKMLYVADTENHLLRQVDLAGKTITTIAGTGQQAQSAWPGWDGKQDVFGQPLGSADRDDGPDWFVGPATETALNSPWALWADDDRLLIAMAGSHQIWWMSLGQRKVGPFAGNGHEDIVDGPLLPKQPYERGFASFAQPSGLTSDGTWLYVADSEGSSIRAVPLDGTGPVKTGTVKTIIGTSQLPAGRLFLFGDRDGQGLVELNVARNVFRGEAEQTSGPLLQHALGVVFYRDKLYMADTYNNKIKVVDIDQQTVNTLVEANTLIEPGQESTPSDEPALFDEPAGITAAAGKLYVADTNQHRIRVIDLDAGNRVTTLVIEGLHSPALSAPTKSEPVP